MFAYFDPRAIVSRFLTSSDCSIAALSRLQVDTTFSKFMLERILKNEKQIDRYESEQLVRLVRDLEAIQKAAPCKLNYSDTETLRTLLVQRRTQTDEVSVRAGIAAFQGAFQQ